MLATEDGRCERPTLDKLLYTCLKTIESFQGFMRWLENDPPSEDFLYDKLRFDKEAERFKLFDESFGNITGNRIWDDDASCLQSLRTALSGVLLLLQGVFLKCWNGHGNANKRLQRMCSTPKLLR